MPHVVYLHSALQKNRVSAANQHERRTLLTFNKWDCIIGLGFAGLVNLAMLCIAAALFHKPGLTTSVTSDPSTITSPPSSEAAPHWRSGSP